MSVSNAWFPVVGSGALSSDELASHKPQACCRDTVQITCGSLHMLSSVSDICFRHPLLYSMFILFRIQFSILSSFITHSQLEMLPCAQSNLITAKVHEQGHGGACFYCVPHTQAHVVEWFTGA